MASVSSEIGIFAHRPIRKPVLGRIDNAYKLIVPVDQTIWNFLYLPITIRT